MAKKAQSIIAGNWKMYKTLEEAESFIEALSREIEGTDSEVRLAVPYTVIRPCAKKAEGTSIRIGAQNMNDATEGAFTGEIAAKMLRDAGATFVLLGHSERRRIFNEENDLINRKVLKALDDGLDVILCVGESAKEREDGKAEEIVRSELLESLKGIKKTQLANVAIAYEPVWAIGTGNTATPAQAEEMHAFCRSCVEQEWGKTIAKQMPILYGGSVTPDVVGALLKKSNINGFLVGGASLSPEKFSQIINHEKTRCCEVELKDDL